MNKLKLNAVSVRSKKSGFFFQTVIYFHSWFSPWIVLNNGGKVNKLPQVGLPYENDRGSFCSFLEKKIWICTAYDAETKQLAELLQYI